MTDIYYLWPYDLYWKNNVLGQRLIMLHPLGNLRVCTRHFRRRPVDLGINVSISRYGLSLNTHDYLSLASYIISMIFHLSIMTISGSIKASDIIYTNFEYTNIIGIWAKKILGLKWVADFVDDPRKGYLNASLPRAPQWRVYFEILLIRIYQHFLREADLVICNAPDYQSGLAPILVKQFRVEEKKLVTVPGGVQDDYIAACLKDPKLNHIAHSLLQDKGITKKQYIYLVGHLNPNVTGVHSVIKALKILVDDGYKYHFILAGFFKHRDYLWFKETVCVMGLSEYVHYIGVVDQPLSYILMNMSGVCICPYDIRGREDFQVAYFLKLLEYITVGAPTITIQTPITLQIVNDFGIGDLIPCSCDKIIAERILTIMQRSASINTTKVPDKYKWYNINTTLSKALTSRVIECKY
jgi:glycosyltransferase involved in cell wall biosynthesis